MFDRSLAARCDAHEGQVFVADERGARHRPSSSDLWADRRAVNQRIRPDVDPLVDEVRGAHPAAPGGHS